MSPREHKWDPDYVVAPGETLREWMDENGLTTPSILAAGCGPRSQKGALVALIEGVLAKQPFDEMTARVLEQGTGVSVGFWMAMEHNYRTGLAAGKKAL